MMRQVSSPVRRGAGRKGRKDLARSLPGFKVLEVLFLAQVSQTFLPSKKACGIHKFQIPSDLVVKSQATDIIGLIL